VPCRIYAWVRNSYIIHRGHQIKNGLKDGFCKNYFELYKIKMTKKLGEDQIKWDIEKFGLHTYYKNSNVYKQLEHLVF
jgi:hypothetical protein